MYFARGANAVNAVGREGFELEDEQRLMIEGAEQAEKGEDGIFSSSTLAAIQGAQGSFGPKRKAAASSGPLVAYDSDTD